MHGRKVRYVLHYLDVTSIYDAQEVKDPVREDDLVFNKKVQGEPERKRYCV